MALFTLPLLDNYLIALTAPQMDSHSIGSLPNILRGFHLAAMGLYACFSPR
jgi:hypothetical protein